MAQSTTGKVSNLTMGEQLGGTKVGFVLKKVGLNKGLAESARGGGGENIREIPLLVREIP